MKCIDLSLEASVAQFQGNWYKARKGIATGGTLCVHIANISVFYAYKKIIYLDLPINISYLFRFIDDGTGGWVGKLSDFYLWFNRVNCYLYKLYNIKLTMEIKKSHLFINFLDVKYRFINCELDTDLFFKPTDAHRFLHYNSAHPNHTFSSVVFSQGLRYLRIISDRLVLRFRLNDLTKFFIDCGYPVKLVTEVLADVYKKTRCLNYNNNSVSNAPFMIPWVTTYGPGIEEVKRFTKGINSALGSSPIFSDAKTPIIQPVTRRGPSIKDMLFKQRDLVLNTGKGFITTKCDRIRCKSCCLMSNKTNIYINNTEISCAGGTCISNNVIYHAHCKLCNLSYFGKTTMPLANRINGHFSGIKTIITRTEREPEYKIPDELAISAHAHVCHEAISRNEFNKLYTFSIVEKDVTPKNLVIREQHFINKYHTFVPLGLNISNPIGLHALLAL